jgi:hypothetical protein
MAKPPRSGHRAARAFGELLDPWFEQAERNGRSPNTLHGYRLKIEGRIRPNLGAIRLDRLNAHTLDTSHGQQLDEVSPASVMHLDRIMSAAIAESHPVGVGAKWRPRSAFGDAPTSALSWAGSIAVAWPLPTGWSSSWKSVWPAPTTETRRPSIRGRPSTSPLDFVERAEVVIAIAPLARGTESPRPGEGDRLAPWSPARRPLGSSTANRAQACRLDWLLQGISSAGRSSCVTMCS